MLELTPKQREALLHRLTVPDALIEALTDDDTGYDPDLLGEIIDLLPDRVDEALARSKELTVAVLVDCVEGSTWVACCDMDDEVRKAAAYRTLQGLAQRLEVFLLLAPRSISIPEH